MKNLSVLDIEKGIKLHVLNATKFKSILIGLYIRRPLCKAEVTLNALLSRVIDRATEKYPGLTDLNQALESLYGGVLVTDVHKYGEKQMIQLKMTVVDGKRIDDPKVLAKAFRLLNEILNAPKCVDGGFDPEIFEMAKVGLASEIEARKEDKTMWTLSKCLENMCATEAYALHEFGTIEDLEKITPQMLFEHYLKVIKSSEMDLIVLGDIEAEEVSALIKEHVEFKREELTVIPEELIMVPVNEVRTIHDYLDVTQARLMLGYRMNISYDDPMYLAGFIGSLILGYGGSSRLFKEVREKASLCYSTFARAERYKSIMFVYAGIDSKNYDQALSLILSEIDKLKQGEIDQEEIEIATKAFVSSLESVSDFPNSYINYYFNQYLSKGELSLEKYIEKINAVTKEEIVEALDRFALDTIVFLSKEYAHDENE